MTIDKESERQSGRAPSTAELVSQASSQISTLIRDELALGRAEMLAKGKRLGIGGGLFGAAGVLALYGLALLLVLAVVGLDVLWPLWLAVLTVALVVIAAAAVAGTVGRQRVSSAGPLSPNETVASLRDDVQTVKDAVQEGRH
jgi:uncharacterized membrane protein YqjE